MRTARLITVVLFAVLAQAQALAWSGPGHAAVAAMAYRDLASNPALRNNLTDLLRSHPKFNEWQQEFNAKKKNFPAELDFGMFLFIRAATWPDEIRGHGGPFDHPNWHFVNYPLRPPTFDTTGVSPTPNDDVLFGIRESLDTLADKTAAPVQRAAALSWLIHLVGDIHQPLHCVALIDPPTFKPPHGDQGGNLFIVFRTKSDQKKDRQTKLHSFWDQQIGAALQPNPVKALKDARQLAAEHPRTSLSELSPGDDTKKWSDESRDRAISDAYKFKGKQLVMERVLPAGYSTNARKVARLRLSLAGYRLSDATQKVAF